MRTLLEILDDAKDGGKPSYEECYWALLAVDAVMVRQSMDLLRLTKEERPDDSYRRMVGHNQFHMMKSALNADPQKWLGPNLDPANPEVQRFRKLAFKVVNDRRLKATACRKKKREPHLPR